MTHNKSDLGYVVTQVRTMYFHASGLAHTVKIVADNKLDPDKRVVSDFTLTCRDTGEEVELVKGSND